MTTLVWFRRDLRLADNAALEDAVAAGPVVCLWVRDPTLLARRHHQAPVRRAFLDAALGHLDAQLRHLGSRLVVRTGAPERVIGEVAAEVGATRVVHAQEVSSWGVARDRRVAAALAGQVAVEAVGSDLLVEPGDLPGSSGEGYRVFTPFFRAWSAHLPPPHQPAPERIDGPAVAGEPVPPCPEGWRDGRATLVDFIRHGVDVYPDQRDVPAVEGTSRLSAHLRLGTITTAQVGRALGLPDPLSPARTAFWRQLAWREFFHHLLARRPQVARTALRPEMRAIPWPGDDEAFAAWAEGRTGFPLVDAGMRQMNATGWMHNRVRMVTASFLVKDLLIDWRRGETLFMQRLVDGCPANNNGGWQWVAGTGADAAPYFRILNPVRQSQRFDPNGDYIRRWVPELAQVPGAMVHEPWRMTEIDQVTAGCRIGVDYPAPMVNHALQRQAALALYRGETP